jgi:uncharacterized protein (UPF0276 family)
MMAEHEFQRRAERIQPHGLGLSVDLYNPNLFELVQALRNQGPAFGYLELFKASEAGLKEVKQRLAHVPIAFHGEGLWLTQPDFIGRPQTELELDATLSQLNILGGQWINHECATKQMAGYSFGTYLPPLFTRTAAEVVAENARFVQARLDRDCVDSVGRAPLLLLELPPWTYFGVGNLDVPLFFRVIADQAPCGFVLDIGHLWTIYRYSGAWQTLSLRDYVARFLSDFPLERVVQIHLAGLAPHEQVQARSDLPLWIDAHGAPISPLLFEMLAQLLASDRLTNLKGLAIEVDTKEIALIVQEFGRFHARFGEWQPASGSNRTSEQADARRGGQVESTPAISDAERARLQADYRWYAQTAAGVQTVGADSSSLEATIDRAMLPLYRDAYLPYEILHWGGDLRIMFPETSRLLDRSGVSLDGFVPFWFREPRVSDEPYDFFLLKIGRFVAFVHEALPWADEVAAQEAADLTVAYHVACENVGHSSWPVNSQ